MTIITKEFVESCRTARGGFTRITEIILSGMSSPSSGWPQRAIGKAISIEDECRIRKSIDRRNNINIEKGRIIERDSFLEAVKRKPPKPRKPKTKKQRPPPEVRPEVLYKGDVNSPDFLFSYEWRALRMYVLKRDGARCACCGASPKTGAVMHVDHIKPRRKYPHLVLEPNNLQVLCSDCNHGKGNWDSTDWRT